MRALTDNGCRPAALEVNKHFQWHLSGSFPFISFDSSKQVMVDLSKSPAYAKLPGNICAPGDDLLPVIINGST
jgi:hypothetical protein